MTTRCRFAVLLMWLVLPVATASAHHSLSVEFDTDKTVTLTGSITEMKWSNPHGWLYIDVKDAKGEIQKWAVEFASPNQLYRRGRNAKARGKHGEGLLCLFGGDQPPGQQ